MQIARISAFAGTHEGPLPSGSAKKCRISDAFDYS